MTSLVLAVEDLTVYRGKYAALQKVSFCLEAGTDTAVVGPNGAGKSTLIQAVLGILPRQSGSISILGQPLSRQGHLPASIRQQIAYLPQNHPFDRLTPLVVEEFVGLGWQSLGLQVPWCGHRKRRAAVREALARVNALPLMRQAVGGLSGGEMKRVLLAYCLVRPRRLLVLDEAPAGLDMPGEAEFYQLLEELKRERGWAILQVSHNLEMVRRQCDRVLCVNGCLLCQGKPEATLSPESLAAVYGSEFARYRHRCGDGN